MEDSPYSWFLQEAVYYYERICKKIIFKASGAWLTKFKKRYGIRMLTLTGKKLSSDFASVAPFVKKFRKRVEERKLTPDQICNADESSLFWRVLPNKTYVRSREVEAFGRKVSKE